MIALRKWPIPFVNWIASLPADDSIGSIFRVMIYRFFGVIIKGRPHICGGQYINGTKLSIGHRAFLNRNCYFDLTGHVLIGDDAVIGHGVTFITAVHKIGPPKRRAGPVTGGSIVVGNGAWIGANATILPNVSIGVGAIIGAESLVSKNIPENTLWAGVPAKYIRTL